MSLLGFEIPEFPPILVIQIIVVISAEAASLFLWPGFSRTQRIMDSILLLILVHLSQASESRR